LNLQISNFQAYPWLEGDLDGQHVAQRPRYHVQPREGVRREALRNCKEISKDNIQISKVQFSNEGGRRM
jgi:hypothetical protein